MKQSVEKWFEFKDVSGKYLNVSGQNTIAIELYKDFGYTITDYRMLGKVEKNG